MSILWMFGFILLALGALGLAILRSRPVPASPGTDWVENFSLDRYRPMYRLLREEDYDFLRSQPGYHRSIEKRLRRERRLILKSYLRNLRCDFSRLYRAGMEMALMSVEDRSELVGSLMRLRLDFYRAMAVVELRLALNGFGIEATDFEATFEPLRQLALVAAEAHRSASRG